MTERNWKRALWRGFRKTCPQCGTGALFQSYLGIVKACPQCGEAMHHQKADDAPPYFTIMIVGHIVVPLMLVVEKVWRPELWVHFSVWLPLTAGLTLWLLPRVKGATAALQWALGMHGFGLEHHDQKIG
jgi:uncharacterized protein (DUF983 family)